MITSLQLQYLGLADPGGFFQPATARLVARTGSIANLVTAEEQLFAEYGIDAEGRQEILSRLETPRPPANLSPISRWLDSQRQRSLLCFEDPLYPPLLKEIDCPPPLLYVEGDPGLLKTPQLAVVGSRKATASGRQVARWLASELARLGFTLTSGLAAGVDGAAHRGALDVDGRSLAVVGTGLDTVYPDRHRDLASQLADAGALVSEFPLGTPPLPGNFPQRNRIIAGLSMGVIVVEAALRSGSLITARLAMEANREVFAVPGSIHNGNARGCHHLIRQGAKLVDSVESVLEELVLPGYDTDPDGAAAVSSDREKTSGQARKPARLTESSGKEQQPASLKSEEKSLLRALEFESCTVDVLVARTGMSTQQINSLLLSLELKGLLTQGGGRYQRRIGDFPPAPDQRR